MAPKDRPKPVKPIKVAKPARPRTALTALVDRIGGSRLCYGDPVREPGPPARTIIPVARVRAMGGGGWGGGGDDEGGGGGGGGSLDAFPLGFIEIGPDGSRFHSIEDPEATMRTLKVATGAVVTLVTTLAGLRAAGAGRRRLLGRGG